MSDKAGLGCIAGLVAFGVSLPGLALVLFGITIVSFASRFVGENLLLLTLYIVSAMLASYAFPLIYAIVDKSIVWLIVLPFVTSALFAVPSSFIGMYGCAAGYERAAWAMRAIPVLWASETLFAGEDEGLSCEEFFTSPRDRARK